MFSSFVGGINPEYKKLTSGSPIEQAKIPERIFLPLKQHIGAPCTPLIKKGDKVMIGQKIADSKEPVSAPIHSPVSGIVEEIKLMPSQFGHDIISIIIRPSGDEHEFKKSGNPNLSRHSIIHAVREAGIVGLGGAMFPAYLKLSIAKDKAIDTVVLNGCECEPYITADDALMQHNAHEIIEGLRLIMRAVDARRAIIGIEDNKKNAIRSMQKEISDENIRIVTLKTRYPQGAEKTLIYSLLKRKVPSGSLPQDIGVVCNNVATAKAIYDAVYLNKPLIERIVTVAGDVKQPKNLLVRIGTPVKSLINDCGSYSSAPKRVIAGGPMMGIALQDDNMPLIKGTNCILVQSSPVYVSNLPSECIRCSKCVDACPVNLIPIAIASFSEKNNFEAAKSVYAMDCYECGACAYACPQKIALVEYIRRAKNEIRKS